MSVVYLLHFEPSYKHAAHYLGYADDLGPRINAHMHGAGARLTQVAHDAGCALVLVRVWEGGDRNFERKLKKRSHVPALCPICQGLIGIQMGLLPDALPFVPAAEACAQDGGHHA